MILYLLVEGDSDRQFIEKAIAPCLPTPVHILAYAEWTATRRENQIGLTQLSTAIRRQRLPTPAEKLWAIA